MIRSKTIHPTQGFTIVELTVIIVVIVILAIATTVSYVAVSDNAKNQAAKTDVQTIATQLHKYKAKHGAYPDSLDSLSDVPGTQAEFKYTHNTATDSYCVTAFVNGVSSHVASGNLDAIPGACTGHTED